MKNLALLTKSGHITGQMEANASLSFEFIDFKQVLSLKFSHSLFEEESFDPSATKEYLFKDCLNLKTLYEDYFKQKYLRKQFHFTRSLVNLDKRV
jgi:hypothetical protein